jgi:hypothetical protein
MSSFARYWERTSMTIPRPSPVPSDPSPARSLRRTICWRASRGMPGPSSSTIRRTASTSISLEIRTRDFAHFRALSRRLRAFPSGALAPVDKPPSRGFGDPSTQTLTISCPISISRLACTFVPLEYVTMRRKLFVTDTFRGIYFDEPLPTHYPLILSGLEFSRSRLM